MKKEVCAQCGSENIYYSKGTSGNILLNESNSTNHILISQGFAPRRAPIDTYVCGECGNVRFSISKMDDLQKIAERWIQINKEERD